MAIVACIWKKESMCGALHLFAASKYHCFEKWAWLTISKRNSGSRHAFRSCFLNFVSDVIQSGSDPDNF